MELPREHAVVIVVGLGYGDESKGATVDWLTATLPDAAAVVRWSGGAQAAHNVRHGHRHHTFSQFGSGTFLDVRTILRAPMLVSPTRLAQEADLLALQGVRDPLGLILADARCLVTTPIHAAMNRAREIARGDARHGSTGIGIGETVAYDLAYRQGATAGEIVGNFPCPSDARIAPLTVGMLRDRAETITALDALARYAEPMVGDIPETEYGSVQEIADTLCQIARDIEIVDEVDTVLRESLDAGSVVFEGSQGLLLDEWHGFHPHTTWSTLTPRTLRTWLRSAGYDPYVLGLTRTYATRHGAGPMPTEDPRLALPEPDNREGRYQGAWRTGHLDLEALRYATAVAGGVDGVGVSHLDMVAAADAAHTPILVADRWPAPLRFSETHDLDRAAELGRVAASTHPALRSVDGGADEILHLISDATAAPVVLTADGPHRLDRSASVTAGSVR